MSETATPDDGDVTSMSDEQVTAPSEADKAVQEIARSHPSAGDDSEVEGVQQEGNTSAEEQAGDGGTGAGGDYAGSGL